MVLFQHRSQPSRPTLAVCVRDPSLTSVTSQDSEIDSTTPAHGTRRRHALLRWRSRREISTVASAAPHHPNLPRPHGPPLRPLERSRSLASIIKPASVRSLVQRPSPNSHAVYRELGMGPLRFAPAPDVPSTSLHDLTVPQRLVVRILWEQWRDRNPADVSAEWEHWCLCFARCSPGAANFDSRNAWKVMKHFDKRYVNLKAVTLESRLAAKTVVPVPGLRTHQGLDVVYVRPSRFHPKTDNVPAILDPLVYVLMNMTVTHESASTNGLCIVLNMEQWTMRHYTTDFLRRFWAVFQGFRAPVRVRQVLIVDPPSWFATIGRLMTSSMMTDDFAARVHRTPSAALGQYLADGYTQHLPDDMVGGSVPTADLVRDYLAFRKYVEAVEEVPPSTRPPLTRGFQSERRVRFEFPTFK